MPEPDNPYSVDAPSVAIPQNFVPTVAQESKVTYADVRFEDTSVNIMEKLSEQLPAFWKENKRLTHEAKELRLAKVKEEHRVHLYQTHEDEKRKAKVEKEKNDAMIDARRIAQDLKTTKIENRRIADEAEAERLRQKKILDDDHKETSVSTTSGIEAQYERVLFMVTAKEISLKEGEAQLDAIYDTGRGLAEAGNAYKGIVTQADRSYYARKTQLVTLRDRLKAEVYSEKMRKLREEAMTKRDEETDQAWHFRMMMNLLKFTEPYYDPNTGLIPITTP